MKRIIQMIAFILICYTSLAQTSDSIPAPSRPHFSYRQLNIPIILGGLGLASNGNGRESLKNEIVEERDEHIPRFHTSIDNYLQFSPIIIAYTLDAAGISSRTDLQNRTAILVKGELMMLASVMALKKLTHQLRPDGSSYTSFPSGHTAQAFAAATFLSEEYKDRFHWMPYAAYGLASAVGGLRMANNRHYISDVLLGAGIGILSTKAAYWTHHYKWGKHSNQLP
jgi:hypothetical protein